MDRVKQEEGAAIRWTREGEGGAAGLLLHDGLPTSGATPLAGALKGKFEAATWAGLWCWHLLNLDAPTVAALWALLLARTAGVRLQGYDWLILALGTWLIYAADRLLDGLPGTDPARLRERHFFHRRWRGAVLAAAVLLTAVLAVLVATRMRLPLRAAYTCLFSLALVYFVAVHGRWTRASHPTRWRAKELVVGALFTAAVTAPAWTTTGALRARLALGALLLAGLCWLNCLAIEHWERGEERGTLRPALWTLLAAATLASFLAGLRPFASAVAASSLLFLALDGSGLAPGRLRILADVALLTPLAALGFVSGPR